MSDNNKVVKAGIGYIIGNYLLKGLSFLTIPIFSHLMEPGDYGMYNTFIAYEAIFYIVIGFAIHSSYKNALYKYSSERGNPKGKDYDTYVSTTMVLQIFSAAVWFVLFLLFANYLTDLLGLDYISLLILLVYSFSGSILACYNAYVGLKYQYKNFLIVSGINAVSNIGLSIFLMFTAFPSNRYIARMIGTVVPMTLIAVFVIFSFFKRSRPGNYKPFLKWGLHYSIPIISHGISQVILAQFDRIMINKMINSESSGIYSFAYNIYAIVSVTARSLDNVWNPWFYEQMIKKQYANIRSKSNIYAFLMMLVSVGIMLVSPELVKLLGAQKYWSASYSVVPIVAGGYFAFLYTIPASVEYFYEKTKYVALGTFAAAVINVVLNFIFINSYGYIAAAYTTLVTYVLYFLFHYIIAIRIHGKCIFSTKVMFLCSLSTIVFTALSLLLFDIIIIRWILAVSVIILFFIVEEKQMGLSMKIIKKFRRKKA